MSPCPRKHLANIVFIDQKTFSLVNSDTFSFQVFVLSYVAKVSFDEVREWLGCRNQTISTLKAQIVVLEREAKEKDLMISSQDGDFHDLRERNEQLAENMSLLQIQKEEAEERHYAKLEEVAEKAKMASAIWFKENTLKRNPEVAASLEWFEAGDDESSDSSDSESDGGQT